MVAACTAAPKNAAEIIAVSSAVTVAGRAALAEQVASAVPSVNAAVLAREASDVRVTIAAGDAATGGTVFYTPPTVAVRLAMTCRGMKRLAIRLVLPPCRASTVPGTPALDLSPSRLQL